jgi:O-antigen/teichoic acid export membrane protein
MLSLSVAEVANKGILFISTIYLARVILAEGYGIISFASSFLAFFSIIVNLGLNTVGSRDIAGDLTKIRKYAEQITSLRLILAIFSFVILASIALFIDKPLTVKLVILISGTNLFTQAFLMDWVYQGNEKMEFLALRQLITSLLSLIGLVIFVKSSSDVITAMVITASSALINSFWMLLLFIKMYGKIKLRIETDFIRKLLKSALPIASSTFFITIYNFLSILMLGFMKTDNETGLYKAAFNFVTLILTPSAIIQNAFFPVLSRAITEEDKSRIWRVFGNLMVIVGVILTGLVFTFSDFFIFLTFGNKYNGSIQILNILMITTFIMYLNTMIYPALVSWKEERKAMYAIAIGGLINIIMNFVLIPKFGANGAAYSTILSEAGVLVGLFLIIRKVINKLYLLEKLSSIALAVLSCYLGYYLLTSLTFHSILSGIISFIFFVVLIFSFRIIRMSDVKGYLKK